jgi:hypothetical protein
MLELPLMNKWLEEGIHSQQIHIFFNFIRVIKAVRRGGKALEPENSEEKSTISTSSSSTNPIPSPIPFSFASNSKITFGTATSISPTTTTITPEIKFPSFQAPVVSSPFTFDFTQKSTSTTTPSTTTPSTTTPTTTVSTTTISSPKVETPKTTSPVSTPPTTPKAQFNFGNADVSVKWPTFEPAALPVFKPDTGLPPFNLGSVFY